MAENTTTKRRRSRREPVCENLSFASREAFKRLRTNLAINFPEEDESCHMIGVTSPQPSDGKSTISVNLAYSLAELGKKVLLIDADMRRSSLHEKLDVDKEPGLSELLRNSNDIHATLKQYRGTKETTFDILTAGSIPGNPSELLNSKRMGTLLSTLAKSYSYIVVDLPPIGAVIDAVSLAGRLDGMLVVVRENTCPRSLLDECMQQLDYAGVKVLGFVVNGAMEGSGKKYQYGKYGKYGYSSYGYY